MRRLLFPALLVLIVASPAARTDDAIPIETLKAIKAATVFVKVEFNAPGAARRLPASGSGFVLKVDGETGLIVTNDHVIRPPAPQFARVGAPALVFGSGTRQERSIAAEVVAADPDRDLAILRVKGIKDLPAPIALNGKIELVETMQVYMFGFPFGEALSLTKGNPAMTVSKGSISSIREDEFGRVKVVQIDGDLNPGNSGGPVVDSKGRLVGVAVARVRNTKIGMAIPPSELARMLLGRVGGVSITTKKIENGAVDIEVQARLIDPMQEIKSVAIHYLRTDALKAKPTADREGKWSALPGAQKVELKIDAQSAAAAFPLKSDDKGRVEYSFQTAYVNGEGKTIYTQPGVFAVNYSKPVVAVNPQPQPPQPQPRPPASGEITKYEGGDLKFAIKIEPFLAAVVDVENRGVLLTTGKFLRHYSYPDFKLQGSYALAAVGYRAVLDSAAGLLYLAVAEPPAANLGHPADRPLGQGDIQVYDVKDILKGKGQPGLELVPIAAIAVKARAAALHLSPDGKWLYFLDVKDGKDIKAVRINTATRKVEGEVKLAEKTETLVLTRDGKTLYAGATVSGHNAYKFDGYEGKIQVIDPATMALKRTVAIDADPYDLDATDDGLVFVSGGSGQHTEVSVIDMKKTMAVIARWKGVYMGSLIRLSPDGKRLYYSSRGLSPGSVSSWVLPDAIADGRPAQGGTAWHDYQKQVALGGDFQISPDGRFLLSRFGTVLWLHGAEQAGPK